MIKWQTLKHKMQNCSKTCMVDLRARSMQCNLLFYNLHFAPEREQEDPVTIIREVLKEKMGIGRVYTSGFLGCLASDNRKSLKTVTSPTRLKLSLSENFNRIVIKFKAPNQEA